MKFFVCIALIGIVFHMGETSSSTEQEAPDLDTLVATVGGLTATLNSVSVQMTGIRSQLRDFRDMVTKLECQLHDQSTAMRDQKREILSLHGMCDVQHGDYCFYGYFVGSSMITMDAAKLLCAEKGGTLADIYSSSHYADLITYLKPYIGTRLTGTTGIAVITAMTYNPKTRISYLSDGSVAPYITWRSGYPNVDGTRLLIWVDSDDSKSGFYDWSPVSTSGAFSSLCQIEY